MKNRTLFRQRLFRFLRRGQILTTFFLPSFHVQWTTLKVTTNNGTLNLLRTAKCRLIWLKSRLLRPLWSKLLHSGTKCPFLSLNLPSYISLYGKRNQEVIVTTFIWPHWEASTVLTNQLPSGWTKKGDALRSGSFSLMKTVSRRNKNQKMKEKRRRKCCSFLSLILITHTQDTHTTDRNIGRTCLNTWRTVRLWEFYR